MKKALYLIMKNSPMALQTLEDLKESGKDIIRKGTNRFSDVRGFMFVSAMEDYEGNI